MTIQQANDGLIGISLRNKQLRMAEAKAAPSQVQLLRAANGTLSMPFCFSILEERSNITTLAQDINRLYDTIGFTSNKASLSLDSDLVLIKKLPYDASLQGDELKEHISWEVSQFMIAPQQNFIVDFQKIKTSIQGDGNPQVVVVVIRKTLVDFIKEIFAGTDLHLRAIDVDVFSAQRLVAHNYELPEEKKACLIDVRASNLQFSVLHHGFSLAHEVDYLADEGAEAETDRNERLARIISKELRRIILDNKLGKSIEDMEEIYIYGDSIDDGLLDILSTAHNTRFHLINPFEKIPLAEMPVDKEVMKHPESFVTSIGAAIKGI